MLNNLLIHDKGFLFILLLLLKESVISSFSQERTNRQIQSSNRDPLAALSLAFFIAPKKTLTLYLATYVVIIDNEQESWSRSWWKGNWVRASRRRPCWSPLTRVLLPYAGVNITIITITILVIKTININLTIIFRRKNFQHHQHDHRPQGKWTMYQLSNILITAFFLTVWNCVFLRVKQNHREDGTNLLKGSVSTV